MTVGFQIRMHFWSGISQATIERAAANREGGSLAYNREGGESRGFRVNHDSSYRYFWLCRHLEVSSRSTDSRDDALVENISRWVLGRDRKAFPVIAVEHVRRGRGEMRGRALSRSQ